MADSAIQNVIPIPTARMADFRRRVAILDFLDAALDAVERRDYAEADRAVAGVGVVLAEMGAQG